MNPQFALPRRNWIASIATLLIGVGTLGAPSLAADAPARDNPNPQKAEGGRRAAGQVQQRVDEALDALNLSPEQRQKIRVLRADVADKLQGLRGQLRDLSPEDRRQRLQDALADVRGQFEAVLTDEQKAAFREQLQARRGRPGKPLANAAPTTQPDDKLASPPPQGPAGRGVMVERLQKHLSQLNLSPEQQKKVDGILEEASKQLVKLREDSKGDLAALREQAKEVFQQTRADVRNVLTADQQRKLQELMEAAGPPRRPEAAPPPPPASERPNQQPPPARNDRGPAGATPPAKTGGNAMNDAPMGGDAMASSSPKPANSGGAAEKSAASAAPAPAKANAPKPSLEPGQTAPAFRLLRLDGRPVTQTTFAGRPLVLVFGSFSSPTFRDKVESFEAMKKALRNRASLAFVYTREGYAANEWDVQQNLDKQIAIDQHATLEDRIKLAKETQNGLKISVDILVDDIDDGVATAYDALPNGAVVIDASGKIVGKQKWADPHGLMALVEDALRSK